MRLFDLILIIIGLAMGLGTAGAIYFANKEMNRLSKGSVET